MTPTASLHVLLIRGEARVEVLDGIPEEYVEVSRKLVPDDQWASWEAGVRCLYDEMAKIMITPTWAKLLDLDDHPKAVVDLVEAKGDCRG